MRRLGIFFITIIMIFQITACESKQETEETEGTEHVNSSSAAMQEENIYKQDYMEACELISKKYIYLESKLNRSREEFLKECKDYSDTINWGNDKTQFIEEIRKLRSKFADGHFDWKLDRENWINEQGKYLGFTLTIGADNKVYVGKVYPYFTDKISAGDEVVKWNGEDIKKEIESVSGLIPQSTKHASYELAARQLTIEYPNKPLRNELKPVTVIFRNKKDGFQSEVEFEWQNCSATAQWDKFVEGSDSNMILLTCGMIPSLEDLPADSKYVHPYLPFYTRKTPAGKFVILHPRSFSEWTVDDLDKTFKQILENSPDALLIDLKDSAGGFFDQVLYLSHALNIDKSFSFSYDMIEPKTDKRVIGIDNFDNISDNIKLNNIWKGKVIFRINSVTVSAGDFFSRWMQLYDRGLIIGRPSAGAGGGTNDFELHNTKTILSIPMRDRKIEKDDKGIEGNSVMPDKIYDGELLDFLNGEMQK